MRFVALLAMLLSGTARADDAPRMEHVAPGYVITHPSWVLNEPGKTKLDAFIQGDAQTIAQCRSDKAALAAEPTITAKGVLIVGGAILVVGFTAGLILGKRL